MPKRQTPRARARAHAKTKGGQRHRIVNELMTREVDFDNPGEGQKLEDDFIAAAQLTMGDGHLADSKFSEATQELAWSIATEIPFGIPRELYPAQAHKLIHTAARYYGYEVDVVWRDGRLDVANKRPRTF